VNGGTLKPDGLQPFPFPSGGLIVQDVGPPDENCVHETVVPFPDGFFAPTFCIGTVNFNVSVVQTGCGIGRIDSDGGSDYGISILGDTSSPSICNLPHAGCAEGSDSAAQVDIDVGDGTPDTCAAGTGNAIVSVPVQTTVWTDVDGQCPDPDGRFDPGIDGLIILFPQIFDFSTDATVADWTDLDPDGCCIAGGGPASKTMPCNAGGLGSVASNGACLDFSADSVALAASGVVSSAGVPLYDVSFTARFPYSVGDVEAPLGATCAAPPLIDFGGTAIRCIDP
jgi:hypothetical protein